MKEVKCKRLYIVATFEPMNNAPKVLSNEGKDIKIQTRPRDGKTMDIVKP